LLQKRSRAFYAKVKCTAASGNNHHQYQSVIAAIIFSSINRAFGTQFALLKSSRQQVEQLPKRS
jgi:hypothetical protein